MSTEAEIQAENARAIQAWHNRPRRRIASPSPRKPNSSSRFNHADQIEQQLQEDGHRTWGFVIYRTCCGNDEDWAEFLKRLRFRMERAFDFYNGRDVLTLFTLTVIEDPERLDGASTAAVRERFRQWCVTAPQSEQQQGDAGSEIRPGLSPRYRYAIQVDAASLQSVVHDAPAPPNLDITKQGWVKLIDASWQPISSERLRDLFEPIEGVIEKDVGWMKIPYSHVMDEYYVRCRNLNWWVTSYQRPPTVAGYPYDG
jgi:hypothetical protein